MSVGLFSFYLTWVKISKFFGRNWKYSKKIINKNWYLTFFDKVRIFLEGHKIWKKIFLLKYSVKSNLKWKIFSNFVAFSEYPNFTLVNRIEVLACLLILMENFQISRLHDFYLTYSVLLMAARLFGPALVFGTLKCVLKQFIRWSNPAGTVLLLTKVAYLRKGFSNWSFPQKIAT